VKIIERYVFCSFLSSFLLSFLVLSFVLTIGLLVQIVGYILDGVPMSLVGEFCLVSLPETLQWSMPLALLVSSVLVFSRMSADNEISAMRACGINLFSVIKWPALFGLVCTLTGVFINNALVPRGHAVRRNLKAKVSVGTGLELLEPGRIIDDFPKVKIYFGAKEGNWLYDLVVIDYSNPKIDRMITASKALVTQQGRDVSLDLYQMTVDPVDEKHSTMARANRFRYLVKDAIKEAKYNKKTKDLRTFELLASIDGMEKMLERSAKDDEGRKIAGRLRQDISRAKVEFSKRLVFALASVCFVLVGIPLGIKAQRKESSVGMAISLGIALGYYMVVILMLSMQKNYAVHPHLLIFSSVAFSMAAAVYFIRKHL
jgi:lipopolysaccharide export system permease protein